MGLIGLFIAVVVMVLGAGYFLFGTSKSAMTVTNKSAKAPIAEELAQGKSAIDVARDVKNLVEQKVSETMQERQDPVVSGNNQPANTPPLAGSVSGSQSAESDQQVAGALNIVDRLMSSGFAVKQSRTIDTIVLHSSYDLLGKDPYSVEGIVKEYEDYGVSAHYLIDRKGTVYRLVEDKDIAYHAGVPRLMASA